MKKCGHLITIVHPGCRLCELFESNSAYRQSVINATNRKIISVRVNKIPCKFLGDEITGHERQKLGLTHLKIWHECDMGHGPQCPCNAACGPTCKDYVANENAAPAQDLFRFNQNSDFPTVGISIGSYGMPGIIELQAAAIRANCGDIPIIVSDDHTEEAGDDGMEKKIRILDICEKYDLIYRETAPVRVGHAGGDLGSFHHGLTYAASKGIEYWLKLSQRFIVDRPMFVQKCAAILKAHQQHTMSQVHQNHGQFYFAMRTEFVLMEVARWHRPDIMAKLTPRPLGRAAEDIVHDCVNTIGGSFFSSTLFTAERSKKHEGVLWYEADGPEGYQRLAEKYGVNLGAGFHAGGSVHSPGFKWG